MAEDEFIVCWYDPVDGDIGFLFYDELADAQRKILSLVDDRGVKDADIYRRYIEEVDGNE